MKQLFIVKKDAALNGGASSPQDLSEMAEGSIGFYKLSDDSAWLEAKAEEDFALVGGTPANVLSRVFPEVDMHSLKVVMAEPTDGVAYKAELEVAEAGIGEEFTVIVVKKGVLPHQRNTFTASVVAKSTDAEKVVEELAKRINAMATGGTYSYGGGINVEAEAKGTTLEIRGLNVGEQFTVLGADALMGVEVTETNAEPAIGDKKYIQDLAQKCAAEMGFEHLDAEGVEIYPGYPVAVEDEKYYVFSLHFSTTRKAGKTGDERVMQYVHIAVPDGAASLEGIKTILGL